MGGRVAATLPLIASVATLLIALCAPPGVFARTDPQEQQTFKAGTNLVVVPVVVVDRKGAPVAGLTAEDFRLEEDGKPVAIETFTAPTVDDGTGASVSRFIVLALDNMSVPAELVWRVKNMATRFIDRIGPNDVMSIIPINGGKAVTTNSKADLKAALSKYGPSAGADVMSFDQRSDHGLRMISALTEQAAQAPHPRKVMVFIGNAGMFSPNRPSAFAATGGGPPAFDLSPEWDDAIKATARNNVSIYVIDPRGNEGPSSLWSNGFASETGGYAWSRTNNFNGATDLILRESASYYLLGYTAPVNDNRLHTIAVKVTRNDVDVRARRARR